MSDNYIVINGKKAVLTEEQLKALGINNVFKSPFTRKRGEKYWAIGANGHISPIYEGYDDIDDELYAIANYCTDFDLMKQRALHETLDRLLWRFSCKNGELENEWNCKNEHWYIMKSETMSFFTDYTIYCKDSNPYFPTKEIAQRAINEIIKPFIEEHKEFIW